MTGTLVSASDDNYRASYERLADPARVGGSRRFGSVVATSSGLPIPLFNRVFVFEEPAPGLLDSAVSWMREQDVPFLVTVSEPAPAKVRRLASNLDLETTQDPTPGMVRTSVEDLPPNESTATFSEVTDAGDFDDLVTVVTESFGAPAEFAEHFDAYYSWRRKQGDRLFLGRVDGQPVASGVLVRTGAVAGIYDIGVIEPFRGRGIGTAITSEVLQAGYEDGCDIGVLQATEMGYPVYEKMGFETVVEYYDFEPVD